AGHRRLRAERLARQRTVAVVDLQGEVVVVALRVRRVSRFGAGGPSVLGALLLVAEVELQLVDVARLVADGEQVGVVGADPEGDLLRTVGVAGRAVEPGEARRTGEVDALRRGAVRRGVRELGRIVEVARRDKRVRDAAGAQQQRDQARAQNPPPGARRRT